MHALKTLSAGLRVRSSHAGSARSHPGHAHAHARRHGTDRPLPAHYTGQNGNLVGFLRGCETEGVRELSPRSRLWGKGPRRPAEPATTDRKRGTAATQTRSTPTRPPTGEESRQPAAQRSRVSVSVSPHGGRRLHDRCLHHALWGFARRQPSNHKRKLLRLLGPCFKTGREQHCEGTQVPSSAAEFSPGPSWGAVRPVRRPPPEAMQPQAHSWYTPSPDRSHWATDVSGDTPKRFVACCAASTHTRKHETDAQPSPLPFVVVVVVVAVSGHDTTRGHTHTAPSERPFAFLFSFAPRTHSTAQRGAAQHSTARHMARRSTAHGTGARPVAACRVRAWCARGCVGVLALLCRLLRRREDRLRLLSSACHRPAP